MEHAVASVTMRGPLVSNCSWPLPSERDFTHINLILVRREEGYGLEGDVYIMYVPEKSLIEVARCDGENIDRLILQKCRLLFLALLSSSHKTNIHTYVHIRKYIYYSKYTTAGDLNSVPYNICIVCHRQRVIQYASTHNVCKATYAPETRGGT